MGKKGGPQRLKPLLMRGDCGTAEAVPLSETRGCGVVEAVPLSETRGCGVVEAVPLSETGGCGVVEALPLSETRSCGVFLSRTRVCGRSKEGIRQGLKPVNFGDGRSPRLTP